MNNNAIVIEHWKKMMVNIGRQNWDAVPSKTFASEIADELTYEVGYWYDRGGVTKLWNYIFMISPVMKRKRVKTIGKTRNVLQLKWYVEMHVEIPGRWNPRDGGDPPCTEEVDMGIYPTLLQALCKVTRFEIECTLNNFAESVMEAEWAKQEQEEMETENQEREAARKQLHK